MTENAEALVGELLQDTDNKLVLIVQESGLAEQKQTALLGSFAEYFTSALSVIHQTQDMEVTSEDQKDDIEQAGIARKELKKIRCEAENQRKALKESALREGQTIDKMFNVIKDMVKPEEDRLEEMEKIAERLAAERLAKRTAERKAVLLELAQDPSVYNYAVMNTVEFDRLVDSLREALKARVDAERRAREAEEAARKKVEEERIAREKELAIEREKMRLENERLKAEAEKREAELKKQRAIEEKRLAAERAEQEKALAAERAKAEEERKKREALESERLAKEKAEAEAKAATEEKQRLALLAPDKDKLNKFADVIDAIHMPNVANREAGKLLDETKEYLERISKNLRQKANQL